eukprot:302965-Prymnesium_polylepis.1
MDPSLLLLPLQQLIRTEATLDLRIDQFVVADPHNQITSPKLVRIEEGVIFLHSKRDAKK